MSQGKQLFEQLKNLSTEQRNPASMDIDARSVEEILRIISGEDSRIAASVESEIPQIRVAVELVVQALKQGGRLIYVGAG
ncbi:MAG: N-acetylmuramic acid 6-phosphate etherase, partial [Bacteroidota bacterium]